MDLRTVLRLLRDRWTSIVILTLLATGTATLLVARQSPVYAAQATLYVSSRADSSSPSQAYQGSLLSQQQVSSYAQLIHTERVLAEAVRALGPTVTTAAVAGRVSALVVPETSLLVITATDGSATGARDTADAVAHAFVVVLPSLEGSVDGTTPAVVVSVVNPAGLPGAPISPRPLREIAIGAVLGLLGGLALAAARQALDQSVKTFDQVQEATQAPSLGLVPHDADAVRQPLVIDQVASRARAEAMRKVSASLRFLDVDQRHGVLLLTSPGSAEGKTTMACNLALTLARAGRRVILVDADLRRPMVANYLGLPGGVGLSSVLVGTANLAEATQQWGNNLFAVLASGPVPPNPTEMLGSAQFRDLLHYLRSRFDFVLIDTAPVLPVADATVAAAACDGIILVARYGRTRRDHVQRAATTLRTARTPILGAVLNDVSVRAGGHEYYYGSTGPDRPGQPEPGGRRDELAPASGGRR